MDRWLPDLGIGYGDAYTLLADAIERAVRAGHLKAGERLPTHRELSRRLGVAVSTVTRGYAEAIGRGLLESTVGRGTFVKAGPAVAAGNERAEEVRPLERMYVSLLSRATAVDLSLNHPLPNGAGGALADGMRALGRSRQHRRSCPLPPAAGAARSSHGRSGMARLPRHRGRARGRHRRRRWADGAPVDPACLCAPWRRRPSREPDLARRARGRAVARHPLRAGGARRGGTCARCLRRGVPPLVAAPRLHHADAAEPDDRDRRPRAAPRDRADRPRPSRGHRRGRRLWLRGRAARHLLFRVRPRYQRLSDQPVEADRARSPPRLRGGAGSAPAAAPRRVPRHHGHGLASACRTRQPDDQ